MVIIPTQLRLDLLCYKEDMRMSDTNAVIGNVILSDKHIMSTNKHLFAICDLKYEIGKDEQNKVIPIKCYKEARALANKKKSEYFRLVLDKNNIWSYVDENNERVETWDAEKINQSSIDSVIRQMYEFVGVIRDSKMAKIIAYFYLGQLKDLITALGLTDQHGCRIEHVNWEYEKNVALEDLKYLNALGITGFYNKEEGIKFVSAFMGSRANTGFKDVDNYLEDELHKKEVDFARQTYYKESKDVLHSDESEGLSGSGENRTE